MVETAVFIKESHSAEGFICLTARGHTHFQDLGNGWCCFRSVFAITCDKIFSLECQVVLYSDSSAKDLDAFDVFLRHVFCMINNETQPIKLPRIPSSSQADSPLRVRLWRHLT